MHRWTLISLLVAACSKQGRAPADKTEADVVSLPRILVEDLVVVHPLEPDPPPGPSLAGVLANAPRVDGASIDATALGPSVQAYFIRQFGPARHEDNREVQGPERFFVRDQRVVQESEKLLLLVGDGALAVRLGATDIDADRPAFGTIRQFALLPGAELLPHEQRWGEIERVSL